MRGIATAAGCQLVASCDLAVAADDALRRVRHHQRRTVLLDSRGRPEPQRIEQRAFEDTDHRAFIDAAQALDWGLLNDTAPADDLDARVQALTDVIVAKSPTAIRYGKRMFYARSARCRRPRNLRIRRRDGRRAT